MAAMGGKLPLLEASGGDCSSPLEQTQSSLLNKLGAKNIDIDQKSSYQHDAAREQNKIDERRLVLKFTHHASKYV
jgi:hypothetical protein